MIKYYVNNSETYSIDPVTGKTSLYPVGSENDRILKDVIEFEIGEKKFASDKQRIKIVFDDNFGNRIILPLYSWLERNNLELVSKVDSSE